MNSSYLQVDPDFYDIIEQITLRENEIKVFYFDHRDQIEDARGFYQHLIKNENGEFIQLNQNTYIRLDRIITIQGRPGPAYDEYENFSHASHTCFMNKKAGK